MAVEIEYEHEIKRLQTIIQQLQDGSQGFEESLAIFKEGSEIVARCRRFFDEAELEIQVVEKN